MGYLLIFVLYYGIGTIIMYTFGATFMKFFERWIKCPRFGEASCFGASLILRVSLALVILSADIVQSILVAGTWHAEFVSCIEDMTRNTDQTTADVDARLAGGVARIAIWKVIIEACSGIADIHAGAVRH